MQSDLAINPETLSKAIAAAEKDIHFYDPPDAELCQALIDAGKAWLEHHKDDPNIHDTGAY